MMQAIFFALFLITLIAGAYSYFNQAPKPVSPLGYVMSKSGYDDYQSTNRKKAEELNVTTNMGIMQIRRQMQDLTVVQNHFLDSMQDQQQVLMNTGKNVTDLMLVAQQESDKNSNDILQLKTAADQMQDQQKLLVAHGQDLIDYNNKLTQDRDGMLEQLDYTTIYNDAALRLLRKRNAEIKAHTAEFFDQMYAYNQEMKDALARMRVKLRDLANAAYEDKVLEQSLKDRIRQQLEQEHEDMITLSEIKDRNKDLWKDVQQKIIDSKEFSNDSQQRAQDLIDEDKQKAQDQEDITKQRIADENQKIRDQHEIQRMKNF